MKRLILISMLALTACSTPPKPRGYELPPAMREVFRGGEIQGLQSNDGAAYGMPSPYDQVQHTCVSTPMYNLDGTYWRTKVQCW